MSTNPWGPNEPASVVLSEEAWLQGATISSIAYGSLLVLFIQCFSLLLKQTKRSNYRTKVPYLVIVFLIFMFGTFFMGSSMKFNQLSFIEDRNYPGGPSAYENDMFAIPVDSLGNVSFTLSQWLCDALLIWRYMMIFKGTDVSMWIIMTLPVLLFLGSFVIGILFLLQLSASSPFVSTGLNWTIPYFSISLAINIFVTIAIVTRLLLLRRRLYVVLGPGHGSQYTSVAAMVVESASIFSVFSLLFLIPFALNSSISQIFLQSMGQVQACTTILIILRAASGKAWSANTQQTLISMQVLTRHAAPTGIQLSRTHPFVTGSESATVIGTGRNGKDGGAILTVNELTEDGEKDLDRGSLESKEVGDRV